MKAAEKMLRQAIEDGVRTGALLPGDPIKEAELCSRFNVSRTPIREALPQLQEQGMVTSLPRAGMVVARMDVAQFLSMWELLAELEGVCVVAARSGGRASEQERNADTSLTPFRGTDHFRYTWRDERTSVTNHPAHSARRPAARSVA